MVEWLSSLREKYSVRPSGVKAGALSCRGPEITPGANTVGTGVAAHSGVAAKARTQIHT